MGTTEYSVFSMKEQSSRFNYLLLLLFADFKTQLPQSFLSCGINANSRLVSICLHPFNRELLFLC